MYRGVHELEARHGEEGPHRLLYPRDGAEHAEHVPRGPPARGQRGALGDELLPPHRRPPLHGNPPRGSRDGDVEIGAWARELAVAQRAARGSSRRCNEDASHSRGSTSVDEGRKTAEAEERCSRQSRAIKRTLPSTPTSAMHGIKGRGSPPGPEEARGGRGEAARDVATSVAPQAIGCAIRGRTKAPGGEQAMLGTGTRRSGTASRSMAMGAATSGKEEPPAKRRREERSVVESFPCHPVQGGPILEANSSTGSCWSSRAALLASLRSCGRPPEGPTQ